MNIADLIRYLEKFDGNVPVYTVNPVNRKYLVTPKNIEGLMLYNKDDHTFEIYGE